MEGDHIRIIKWLKPLSYLYGLGVKARNLLFEMEILKSRSFDVPVISVGNITVGGSGKTPHVEYLIELLRNRVKVAVLSRGYKRKTHGFVLADEKTTMPEIGDEPYQMHTKYPDITFAVDPNRCHGIDMLLSGKNTHDVGAVLLDDAFQHRYVKPGMNILLTDYHRIITEDALLPAGRLREPAKGKDRADIVIVTKCPADLKPMAYRVLQRNLNLYPYQSLFFTTIKYGSLTPIFQDASFTPSLDLNARGKEPCDVLPNVILLTGIASPKQLYNDLKPFCGDIKHLRFADHHQFTSSDAESISFAYKMAQKPAVIITTEKDAMRLMELNGLSEGVRKNIYYLPIKIEFLLDGDYDFNQKILNYVRKSSCNGGMAQGAHDHATADRPDLGNRTGTGGGGNRDLFGNPV